MAREYDLEQDTPYGIASADLSFPIYERPQLMFANLLKGDVDGLTRSMLSPSTLSPRQIQTVRDILMPGKKVNPILATITDIATNPLVILGLAVGVWKFPLGTTKPILALRRGLLPKAAAMGPLSSGLHDAMMNLRSVPGLFENMLGVVQASTDFSSKQWLKLNDIFKEAGKLSKAEALQISARLDGLHKADHYLVKTLRDEPEWVAFMGGLDVPVAPGLQRSMSQKTISISDKLRSWYKNIRSEIMENPDVKDRIRQAVEKRGLQFGEDVEDYFPHQGDYDRYYKRSLRGTTGVQYRNWLHKEIAGKVGREEIQRVGGMFPDLDELRSLEDAGTIKQGFTNMVQSILNRRSAESGNVARGIWNEIRGLGLDDAIQRSEFVRRMSDYYTTGAGKGLNFVGRLGSKKRAIDTLDAMAGALQDAAFKRGDAIQNEFMEIGKTLASPARYSLNLWEATGRYINSVANAYAWHGTGLGQNIMQLVAKPNVFAEAPHLESYVMDDLLPHIQGLKSYPQMIQSLNFSVRKEKIFNWLSVHPLVEQTIGSERKKWLLDFFGKRRSLSSGDALGSSISHYFYLSSLGLNLSSSAKNSLQTLITTMNIPGIGPQGIWRGLRGFGDQEGLIVKIGRYLENLPKIGHESSFNKAFPEFVKDAGQASKIVEAMLAGDVAREGYTRIVQPGHVEAVKKVLLGPFTTTEVGNRLLAFYAGRNSHLFHNAAKYAAASAEGKEALLKEAGVVGQTLNMMANFTGGPLGLPKALINMNPVWRQFAHFPLRFAGMIQGSLRMGADPNKIDWGTMGRALAGSTATYIAARNMLGVDLSSGLLTGALPLPQYEKSPFYPWPVVPPAAQLIGTGVMALAKGDVEGLAESAGLLLPGGIAVKRAYQTLSPHYADYTNPTPDGRIPLYSRNKSLIGTLTPMELTLRSIGLRPTNISAEVGAAKWLLSQRDRIRQYRRNYTEALAQNDMGKAEKVNAEFQRVYPELGPLQIKKTDLRALENRKQISRLTRIEKGFPTAYRPLFSQVIAEAGLGVMVEDIEAGGGGLQDFLPVQ